MTSTVEGEHDDLLATRQPRVRGPVPRTEARHVSFAVRSFVEKEVEMPRARKRTTGSTSAPRKRGSATRFTCPECGRTFATAAALGSHRSRAHGVAGQSARAQRSR